MGAFLRGGDAFGVSVASSPISGEGDVLRVYNETTADRRIRTGVGPQVASALDIVVPARSEVVIHIGFDADNAASTGGGLIAMRGSLR
jgi:hypothetical protein